MVWLSANFECMSEMYGTRLAEMQDSKSRQNRHLGTIAQLFLGLYLRNQGTYRQSEKTC